MDGEKIDVVENNDHLGLIISGDRQYEKNIDLKIKKSRNSLFTLLGPAFQYKCMMSPGVKIHLFRIYICSTLRSGLSSMALSSRVEILLLGRFQCKRHREYV